MNRKPVPVTADPRRGGTSTPTVGERPKYPHLEEAARKIAKERLARIGYTPNQYPRKKMQLPHRSNSLTKSRTEERAEQINVGMQNLNDGKKKGQDALLLMTVARLNVL